MAEQLANNPNTKLNGAISNSVTTITVLAVTTFPATGNFRIVIDTEIMLVTAVNAGTHQFTVVRGQEGTTAVVHADQAQVAGVLTKAGLTQWTQENTQPILDVYANRPAANTVPGRTFYPTDGIAFYLSDGTNWNAVGPITPIHEITSSQFAWINQGSATAVWNNGSEFLTTPAAAADSIKIRKKTLAATSNYSALLGFSPALFSVNTAHCGLVLRESSSSKLITITFQFNTNWTLGVHRWTNETTYLSTDVIVSFAPLNYVWFKVVDDGTNRGYYFSVDGINFKLLISASRTAHAVPNEGGYYVSSSNATYTAAVSAFSWKDG
jgi:hypothetical protein